MDNRKKIIFGLIAGIIFIIAFILNLLFPPKPFIKSAHADGLFPDPAPGVDMESLIDEYGYFVPGNQITQSDNMVDNIPLLKGWVPDDYTYGDFLLDAASAFIGSFTACNSETVDIGIQIIENLIESEGFFIDTTSGFIAVPNLSSTLGDFARLYGYDSTTSSIGNWIKIPFSFQLANNESIEFEHVSGDDIYICQSGSSLLLATRSSSSASFKYKRSSNPSQWYNNGCYPPAITGYFYTGFAASLGLTPKSGVFSPYVDNSAAYADFFGETPVTPGDLVLNGSVYIDDTLSSVNILDIPGNDGRARSIQRNTDFNNNIANNYGGYNNIVLSPKLEDIPNNHEYELPVYPEIPHDLPAVMFEYPDIVANEEISEGLDGLSPLWVTLLTMGGSFIVLKVIL